MNTRRLTLSALAALCALAGGMTLASGSASAALQMTYQRQLTGFRPLEPGSGLGAESIAVNDVNGDVFVAESYPTGSTIKEFDSLGTQLATWEGANTPAGAFGGDVAVAVNDATGNVYVTDKGNGVVDIFGPEGTYISQFGAEETPAKIFGSLPRSPTPGGAAIDQATGEVYVPDPGHNVVDVFDASGSYLRQIFVRTTAPEGSLGVSVAVDGATGDMYVAESIDHLSDSGVIYKYSSSGALLATWRGLNTPLGFGEIVTVAMDEATGDVLVATSTAVPLELANEVQRQAVDVFDPAGDYLSPQIIGTPKGSFPQTAGSLERGRFSLAADSVTGEIYVAPQEENAVDVFSSVVVPGVIPGVPSSVQPSGRTLTLGGAVNPDGLKVSECKFEYGTEAGVYPNESECAHAAQIGEGKSAVPVGAEVSGLQPDTLYHFRLDAANTNGVNTGQDATFFTSTAPLVEAGSVSNVGSVEVSLSSRINAAALMTSYRVEYGPSTESGYGFSTDEASLGDSEAGLPVTVQLSGLLSDTEYHYRLVATNSLGTTLGGPEAFRTLSATDASSEALPDGRFYELVTASSEDNDAYVPKLSEGETSEILETYRPIVASRDGSELAFVGDPVPGGNGAIGSGFGNEFLGSRAPGANWASKVIAPPGITIKTGAYMGLSSDLSVGVLSVIGEEPLTPEASVRCKTLYSYTASDGRYQPLFNKTKNPEEACSGAVFAGISADGSHIAFEMPAALTTQAPGSEEADLYDFANGQLNVVNVLPNGVPEANAAFGSPNEVLKSHVVSADGSRMFWTDLNDHDLYVREDDSTPQARTVLVSEGGEYATASNDGSLAFFTKAGDLYSFDVNGEQTSDLTPGAEVQGVIGASEDGSYVYFVGKGVLKEPGGGALKNAEGEEPQAGEENVYVSHDGTVQFVTVLREGDSADWQRSIWQEGFGGSGANVFTTAEVAPGGHGLVFESGRNLTSYDSQGANEVYVYEADAGKVYCASCNPTGAPPVAGGAGLSLPTNVAQLPRWIDEEGSEVFFQSAESLVPQEAAGKTEVYEWQREGAGGCQQSAGCLRLLSVGAVKQESIFLDASASGRDVFFATRAHLLSEDQSDNTVIYDARVGSKPLTPPACTGSGCQGVPGAPPIFATPSSVTFNGVGNFVTPAPATIKAKSKSKSAKCRKGLTRKKGKCVKKPKPKRRGGKSGKRSKRGNK